MRRRRPAAWSSIHDTGADLPITTAQPDEPSTHAGGFDLAAAERDERQLRHGGMAHVHAWVVVSHRSEVGSRSLSGSP
jgi:hypothetical protein